MTFRWSGAKRVPMGREKARREHGLFMDGATLKVANRVQVAESAPHSSFSVA